MFLLFLFSDYAAQGGMRDLQGMYDTLEYACIAAANEGRSRSWGRGHVLDSETLETHDIDSLLAEIAQEKQKRYLASIAKKEEAIRDTAKEKRVAKLQEDVEAYSRRRDAMF